MEGLGGAPHEVGDDEGGGSGGALGAMNEDAGAGERSDLLEIIEGVVEDGGDVLGGGIVEPEGLVNEIAAEVVGAAGGSDAVEDVGDAVAAEGVAVAGDGVAAEVDVVGDAGAVAVAAVEIVRKAGGLKEEVVGVEVGPGGEGRGRAAEGLERRERTAVGLRNVRLGERGGGGGGAGIVVVRGIEIGGWERRGADGPGGGAVQGSASWSEGFFVDFFHLFLFFCCCRHLFLYLCEFRWE